MSLIVEDGRCPAFANSYVSLEHADVYLVGRALWPATEMVAARETDPSDTLSSLGSGEDQDQAGQAIKKLDEGNGGNDTEEKAEAGTPGDKGDAPVADPEMVKLKEAALIRAFDFLNTLKWKGQKPCWERTAAWPREKVPIPCLTPVEYIDPDLIPNAVIQAQCELAGLIFNGYGPFAPVEHGGKVKSVSDSESKGLDVLSKQKSHSVTYADDAPVETWLPSVYPLLAPFLEEIPGQAQSGFSVHEILKG